MARIILLLCLLTSVVTYAQPGYTKISSRYAWIATRADSGLHVPQYNGVPTDRVGVWMADGAIAADTLNSRFYVRFNGVWTAFDPTGSAWKLTGNSGTTPGTDFIGTTDAVRLDFRTNDVIRQTIGASGNVGIGTTNPQALFHVDGSLRFATGAQGLGKVLVSDADGDADWVDLNEKALTSSGSALGNSTIDDFSCGTLSVPGLLMTTSDSAHGTTITNLAVAGHTIAQQIDAWLAYADKATDDWVIIEVGLNNLNPATSAAVELAEYQSLIDTIRFFNPTIKIMVSAMTPCKARLESIYPPGVTAYQKWLDMNNAIMGGQPNRITGVDYRVNTHVALLNDGTGNLLTKYDCGDGIHENNDARAVIAKEWRKQLNNMGFLLNSGATNQASLLNVPTVTTDGTFTNLQVIQLGNDYSYFRSTALGGNNPAMTLNIGNTSVNPNTTSLIVAGGYTGGAETGIMLSNVPSTPNMVASRQFQIRMNAAGTEAKMYATTSTVNGTPIAIGIGGTATGLQPLNISSSDLVGIGTASPDSLLTVQLGLWGKRGVRFSGLPTGPGTKAVRIDANGVLSMADTSVGGGSARFGVSGEDDIATQNRSFDADGFDFVIHNGNDLALNADNDVGISAANILTIGVGANELSINSAGTTVTGPLTARWKARVGSTASSATPTIDTDNTDIYKLTALAANITSFTTNLTGTPNDGDILEIQITDDGTPRTIAWGASFSDGSTALPVTTVASTTLTVVLQYYTTSSYGNNTWVCASSY